MKRSALPRSVSTLVQGERPLEEPQGLVTRTEYLVGRGVNLGELQNLGSGFQVFWTVLFWTTGSQVISSCSQSGSDPSER